MINHASSKLALLQSLKGRQKEISEVFNFSEINCEPFLQLLVFSSRGWSFDLTAATYVLAEVFEYLIK